MAKIVAGIGTSHVPSIGVVYDKGEQESPAWKPLFEAYVPVREWLDEIKPDIAIMVYNDHGCDFFFDKYPTFALGAAAEYPIGDEGHGVRKLPPVTGDVAFSNHLAEHLVYNEFDLTVCQEMAVEHGFLVPMNVCLPNDPDWPMPVIPLQVNVLRHPIPTAKRCYDIGAALKQAVEAYPEDLKVLILGTGGMSHQLHGERFGHLNSEFDNWFLDKIGEEPEAITAMTHHQLMEQSGAEGVELIMWLTMRGAMGDNPKQVHRHYYAPMTTGMGIITFENL